MNNVVELFPGDVVSGDTATVAVQGGQVIVSLNEHDIMIDREVALQIAHDIISMVEEEDNGLDMREYRPGGK